LSWVELDNLFMKYWLYSNGNILGPYLPEELSALPAFSRMSLVCPEDASGANPDDWKPAEEVPEINKLISVGVSSVISSDNMLSSAYALESGLPAKDYFSKGQGSVLEEIDNILDVYGTEEKQDLDYNFADKFDIKLSKMQEELEAAKWEKTLLIEKVRAKETEEEKNKRRIEELEQKLNEALKQINELKIQGVQVGEIHKAIEEIDKKGFPGVSGSDGKEKKTRSISEAAVTGDLKAENLVERGDDSQLDIASGRLKSVGRRKPQRIFEDEGEIADGKTGVERASDLPQESDKEDLKIEPSSIVYDFTAVTGRETPPEKEKIKITIEPNKEAVVAPESPAVSSYEPLDEGRKPKSARRRVEPVQSVDEKKPESESASSRGRPPKGYEKKGQSIQKEETYQSTFSPSREEVIKKPLPEDKKTTEPEAVLGRQEIKPPTKETEEKMDKTRRMVVSGQGKKKKAVDTKPPRGKTKKSSIIFISVLTIFAVIVLAGLGFFFFNDKVSFADFSMLGLSSQKEEVGKDLETPRVPPSALVKKQAKKEKVSAAEKIKLAVDIVKNYRLKEGKGTIETWLSNSYYSGSSANFNSEWSATILHKNIYVVQYRLLRQKKEPVVYQFEVDVEKKKIVRGINNNAIDLLSSSSSAKRVKKKTINKPRQKRRKVRKARPESLPQLSLPEPPQNNKDYKEPTGFENVTLSANDKVRYIVAQESDEELF